MVPYRIRRIVITIIALVLLGYSAFRYFVWAKENNATKSVIDTYKAEAFTEENNIDNAVEEKQENNSGINFKYLRSKNPDTVGWIKVEGTNIDYPVVHGENNDFYLNHSFDKSLNAVGWVFADFREKFDGNDRNLIIYGHNRRDGTMFGTLKNILKASWYNDNDAITYSDDKGEHICKIFSIYRIEKEDYYISTDFSSDEEYLNFLNTIKNRSLKDYGIELNANNKIVTLSTCANDNRYRVVLHAVLE